MRHLTLALLGGALLFGCDGGEDSEPAPGEQPPPSGGDEQVCVGKCDGLTTAPDQSRYTVDLAKANAVWARGGAPVEHLADLYAVTIKLPGGQAIKAASHLFGGPVVPIPYHDQDGDAVRDAADNLVGQGDRELARFFPPGAIGYAIKHHRPEKRTLDFGALSGGGASASALKEDMKLQDTHIELVVGVRRPLGDRLVDGVITLNNPQTYQRGRFGDEVYSMVFVRPRLPAYAPVELRGAFEDNIRTMMVAFNAVSKFPGDYNGGDPLAASTPDKVREHVRQMVLAIAGEPDAQTAARAWFTKQENMIYCAELAHVSTSAGLLVPINRAGLVDSGLVDAATYDRFVEVLAAHDRGEATPLTDLNDNHLAKFVEVTAAPADLKPLPSYGDAGEATRLAFRPLTMVEIVEGFLKTHIPRNDPRLGGEALAPLQAAVLQAMKPGLFEAMGMDDPLYQSMVDEARGRIESLQEDLNDPELDAARQTELEAEAADWRRRLGEAEAQLDAVRTRRQGVEQLFAAFVQTIGKQYEDYAAFRQALAPLLATARTLAGPRDDSGTGFFVPPSALHLVAQANCDGDDRCGGLIGLDYVGHGVHLSMVRLNDIPPPPPPAPVVTIYEAVPRPSADLNGDGTFDARDDESVVLSNDGDAPADLSGWTLADRVKVRFTFPDGLIMQPGTSVGVYGGGEPVGAFNYAAGALGLNDTGDTLTLFDAEGNEVDRLEWGPVAEGESVYFVGGP